MHSRFFEREALALIERERVEIIGAVIEALREELRADYRSLLQADEPLTKQQIVQEVAAAVLEKQSALRDAATDELDTWLSDLVEQPRRAGARRDRVARRSAAQITRPSTDLDAAKPDCVTMPESASVVPMAPVVSSETFWSRKPCGIDTDPGATSSVMRAVVRMLPVAVVTLTADPSAMPVASIGLIQTSPSDAPRATSRSAEFIRRMARRGMPTKRRGLGRRPLRELCDQRRRRNAPPPVGQYAFVDPTLAAGRIRDEHTRLRERRDSAFVALHRINDSRQTEPLAQILEDVEHRPSLERRLDDRCGALRADDRRESIDEPRDVLAFQLTGDGQHVRGERDGLAFDHVGGGEHVEL